MSSSGAAERAVALARTLGAAEAVGGAAACVDDAVDYAKQRVQFGRTIGTFQAIKHHCADMLVAAELATAVVWDAARASADGSADEFSLVAAMAATLAFEPFVHNAQMNIQVHGGIGFTWEHDAHLYLRRALVLNAVLGTPRDVEDVTIIAGRGTAREVTLELPPEAEQLRAELRVEAQRLAALGGNEQRKALIDSGLMVPHWPRPWGRDAGAVEQLLIDEELKAAGVTVPGFGITGWNIMTVNQYATPDQVDRWVEKTLMGELVWCQLFSEPDAGSDAAAVKTRGTRVDGGWKVNGQKVWTSGAQHCDLGLATVRTDPDAPKHAGITTMVIDMHGPGVEVRPLRMITGNSDFNEVFFNDVFVPDDDVVGTPERRLDGGPIHPGQRARLDRRWDGRRLHSRHGPLRPVASPRRPGSWCGGSGRGNRDHGSRAQGAQPSPGPARRDRVRPRPRRQRDQAGAGRARSSTRRPAGRPGRERCRLPRR